MNFNLSLRTCAHGLIDAYMSCVFADGSAGKVCEQSLSSCQSVGYKGDLSSVIEKNIESIKASLEEDTYAAMERDPAANSPEEVVLCYPGLRALAVYRLANVFYRNGVTLLPRILTETAHSQTGVDIHPGASIGRKFFIDHATGVVIGETTVVHDNVTLYQGVTLGALRVERAMRDVKRHPTLESGVTVYSNATILGGETVIGENSVIGGNVFLTESVPPNSLVYELHKTEVKNNHSARVV